MPSCLIRGADFHYELAGDAEPVLTLVHGGLAHSAVWRSQVPPLSLHARVLSLDLRGYGESGGADSGCTVAGWARDLIGLWDALELESSYLLGFSLGGMIAQEVALLAPERVAGLVLQSTSARLDEDARRAFMLRADVVEATGLAEELATHLQRAFSPRFLAEQPELVECYRREVARTDPAVLAASFRAVASFHRLDELPRISCPTLVLAGEEDQGGFARDALALRATIPNAALAILAGVGHTIHLEAPSTFTTMVRDFVDSRGTVQFERRGSFGEPLGEPGTAT
ncbi:MAG: alpha/beta hydrolase [Actinomycetota bacterium]